VCTSFWHPFLAIKLFCISVQQRFQCSFKSNKLDNNSHANYYDNTTLCIVPLICNFIPMTSTSPHNYLIYFLLYILTYVILINCCMIAIGEPGLSWKGINVPCQLIDEDIMSSFDRDANIIQHSKVFTRLVGFIIWCQLVL
jgi:hypothetical protein